MGWSFLFSSKQFSFFCFEFFFSDYSLLKLFFEFLKFFDVVLAHNDTNKYLSKLEYDWECITYVNIFSMMLTRLPSRRRRYHSDSFFV